MRPKLVGGKILRRVKRVFNVMQPDDEN